ncbi:MAG TPA: SusC/RagA family TonB-linked outer membrane protein [Longimicrobiales bacterium]|nr:SusC/RagA family TonB-linked outer membrane protein [Longimicrobiales bacterium]
MWPALRILPSGAVLLLLTLPVALTAQTGRLQGRVLDASSQRPLQGAQVLVVGTGAGTVSGANGRYLIMNVPAGPQTVRVQLIGYGQTEREVDIPAGGTATLDIALDQSAIELGEVVVTGQGEAVQRRQLSTTVDVIGEQEIALAPAVTVDQLLQGRVEGATVNMQSAQPGTSSLIRFRGVKSVFASQTPVIYIDGVRVDNDASTAAGTGGEQSSALADLLTADIERIEIIKGGAASTLYGSDAANGVIQIFTKKGRPGAPRITVRTEMGQDVPELKYMFDVGLTFPDQVEAGEVPADFLEREFFRTGFYQRYHAGVSGGESAFTYNVSANVQNGEGIQPKNDNTLYALRGGLVAHASERFQIDFSGSYTRSSFGRLYNGTAIADPLTTFEVGDALFFSGADSLRQALRIFLMPDIDEQVDRFLFSTAGNYRASDLISARLAVGVDTRASEQRQFHPIGFTPGEIRGGIFRFDRKFNSVTLEAATTLSWPRGDWFESSLTLGAQGFRDVENVLFATGVGFALPGAPQVDQAAIIDASEARSEVFNGGYFAAERLTLWDRLTLDAGVRLDFNSAFGEEVGFEAYPKAGIAYVLSEEPFFRDAIGFISDLKLRAAYGQAGKFPQPFLRDRTFNAISFRGESAPRFDNPGNFDLAPEVTSTREAGFDLGALNNRLGLSFTWYDATTDDALMFVPEPPTTGQGTQLRNVGQITNTGIEVGANATLLNRRDYVWTVNATFQTVDNRVTDMSGAAPFFVEAQKYVCGPPHDCDPDSPGLEEMPVGAWYLTTPIDTNGDGFPDASERRFTGTSALPDRSGSFGTRLTMFNRLTVSALADWATGFDVFDWGSVWATFNGIFREELLECPEVREDPEAALNCPAAFPIRYDLSGEPVRRSNGSLVRFSQSAARSAFIQPGDYLKFRELSARYTVPEGWLARTGLAAASVYGSWRNVATFSQNILIDPELNGISGGGLALGGESSITLSPPKMFRLGVEVNF